MKLLKLLVVLILSAIAINPLCAKSQKLDSLIENKIQAYGVLTFTQKELSKSLLVELIDREKSFTLTHLGNRDRVVEEIEAMLKKVKQKYQVKSASSKVTKGVVGYFLGGITGAFLGYFSDFTKSDIQWLILESSDSQILDVVFVKDLTKEQGEE